MHDRAGNNYWAGAGHIVRSNVILLRHRHFWPDKFNYPSSLVAGYMICIIFSNSNSSYSKQIECTKKLEVVVLLLFVLLHCKSDTWIARHNLIVNVWLKPDQFTNKT